MARVAYSTMAADEVTDNIEAAVQTLMAKIQMVSLLTALVFIMVGDIHKIHSLNNVCKFSFCKATCP